jgi:hypothetical protein
MNTGASVTNGNFIHLIERYKADPESVYTRGSSAATGARRRSGRSDGV